MIKLPLIFFQVDLLIYPTKEYCWSFLCL